MLDIKLLRESSSEIEAKLKTKDPTITLQPIIELDEEVRSLKTQVDSLKSKRNDFSKQIGEKKRAGEEVQDLLDKVSQYGDQILDCDTKLGVAQEKIDSLMALLPNIPCDGIKASLDPQDNVCVKEHGAPTSFSFPIKNHLELNERLHLFDFDRGAKMAGTGWPVYKGIGARLEWGLINMMLDYHIQNGFMQWMMPLLVRPSMMYGSGQFPKFEDQVYALEDKQHKLCLLPTAEVALNALHYDEIFSSQELPKRYVAYTPCFRREAGAAGKNERGLIRTHQFNKVEMFAFCRPDQSDEMFDAFVKSAEELLEMLELPYKRMMLVTGDMSFPGTKTVDVEVFLPGQERYMEVSSVSHCSDFQSRRSKTRFKEKNEKPQLVHTLNGSGLATSRVMVALLENHQKEDGSVAIPKPLQKYIGGQTILHPQS